MKLAAPCVFGSLLAFLSLSWIKADDEVVLKGQGFGPCVATLRSERACSPGQHDATCPYLLHLPPLTVHLPKQFQELERIMQDLQKLKESVDELREMCANCTVSQTGGNCGRQSGEHEKMTAGKGTREDERNWVRVILEENDGDFTEECEKDKKTKKTYEDNTDDWLVQEGMEEKKLKADKTSDKKDKEEKETKEIVVKNNKNTKTEAAGQDNTFDETQKFSADINGKTADLMTKEVAKKNLSEPERNKEDSTKEDTKIYSRETRPNEEEYIQKNTKTKETDGIDSSVNQENREETKKTLGDGEKVNRNNEKPEQTELTENYRTIKEMGLDEKSRAIGKEIKTERVNGDGEFSSSKTTEKAGFVSISPTPQVKMRTASRADSMDLRKLRTFTSSLPLPPFPSFTLSSITDVSQSTAAGHGPTQSTGPNTAGVPGPRSFDADLSTDRFATATVGGPGLQTVPNSASTRKLEGQLQGAFGTSTTTPTAIHQKPYMTASPRAEDDSHRKSETTGRRPQPGQELHPGKKYPLGTKPEAKKKLKNPPNKPDQALSPVKKSPSHQKEKSSLQNPKTNKSKPDKDSIQTKNVKPVKKRFPDISKPNKNQKNNSLDTHKQGQPPDKDKIPSQSITFSPTVLKPTTYRPQLVNTTLPDEFSSKTGGLTTKHHENHTIKSNMIPNENSTSKSKYEENIPEQDNITPDQDVESGLKIPAGHLNQKPKQEKESYSDQKTTARPEEKPKSPIKEDFKENKFLKPNLGPNQTNTWQTQRPTLSRNFFKMNQTSKLGVAPKQNPKNPTTEKELESTTLLTASTNTLRGHMNKYDDFATHRTKPEKELIPKWTTTPVQTTVWSTQRPTLSRNFPKMNQTSKLGVAPKQNPKFKKPGTGLNINPNKNLKPGQAPQTNPKVKAPKPGQNPRPGFKPFWDKIHKAQSNRTTKPRPPSQFRPPTRPTLEPPAETIQRPNPGVQPQPKLTIKSDANPTQSSWTSTTIQTMSTMMQPTSGFVKEMAEETHTPLDNSSNVNFTKTITEQSNNSIYSTETFNGNLLPEPKSNLYSASEEEKTSQLVTSTASWDMKPTQKTSTVHQNPKIIKEQESAADPTPTPKPLEGLKDVSDNKRKSKEEPEPKPTPIPLQNTLWPTQRPTLSRNFPKMNQTSKLGVAPKQNQKFKKPGTGLNINPNKNLKPGQAPQTNPKVKAPKPGQNPRPGFKPFWDKIHKAHSNRTTKPRPPSQFRPPTRPTLGPPVETNKRVNPAVQPQPKQVNKTHTDATQISWTSSDAFQNTNTNPFPTSRPVKPIFEMTHSMRDSNNLINFPSSPKSRSMSDMKPQKTTQPPLFPVTTKPSKIHRGILQNIILNTTPGYTGYGISTSKLSLNVERSTPATTVPSPSSKTTYTIIPDSRSVTTATSSLDPQTSADSTRELRVKIKQVAAFPKKRLRPDKRPAVEHPKQQPKGPDARRDCSDLFLLGEKRSGVYVVNPVFRKSFKVFCNMEQEGGGWTVLQRRLDGSVRFNRTWAEYRFGFGVLDGGEFWLGNNVIHLLTHDRDMMLRVELEDFNGVRGHAEYAHFKVASEKLQYRLTLGGYTGTAGDALLFSEMYNHNNTAFTTPDKDNDHYPSGNCGAYYSSGWWFDACMAANLNGRYYVGPYKGVRDGIFWGTWHNISREYYPTNERHSFKTVRMMIRPAGFRP